MSWCWVLRPAAGGIGKLMFWFSSRSGKSGMIRCSSLCASLGTSHNRRSRVILCIFFVGSGLGGHSACAAIACLASIFSSSASLDLLRVPTPGAIFLGARQVPRPGCVLTSGPAKECPQLCLPQQRGRAEA